MRQATEIKNSIIALTSNPDLQAKLRNKLDEYATRASAAVPPEKDPDSVYKYRLLSELVEKAIVDVEEMEEEFAKYPWFSHHLFLNAVGVITAYNADKPDGLRPGSGTGLK